MSDDLGWSVMPSDRDRFALLLRARHPLITISTNDEDRTVETIVAAALAGGRQITTWTLVRGVYEGAFDTDHGAQSGTEQPAAALRWCWQAGGGRVFLLLDLAPHLGNEIVLRALRELVSRAGTLGSTVVMVDHQEHLPEIITREAVSFVPSLPDDQEIFTIVRATVEQLKKDKPIAVDLSQEHIRAAVRALRGLTRTQIRRLVADAMAEDDRFDATDVEHLGAARARFVGRGALLESVPVGQGEVAGAERLKQWLAVRRAAFDAPASAGLDAPRGVLLLGVPGSGKSLFARAVARWWNRPLLRLDVGSLYNQFVGESERRLREALLQAEAMAPAVLWVDEIEKAFASAASQSTDGGLSQRMFGSLLTWMQERRAPVFLVATANNLDALPPELLRKGRFDEIFFVDLPSSTVRREIARIHLANRKADPTTIDLDAIANASAGCTGADIEAAIVTAVLHATAAKRPVITADVLQALADSAPISLLMQERITALRAWARERCRFVDDPEQA
jgi:SpoVK/Ycf46/Vps4 family AAA+-type ATPase